MWRVQRSLGLEQWVSLAVLDLKLGLGLDGQQVGQSGSKPKSDFDFDFDLYFSFFFFFFDRVISSFASSGFDFSPCWLHSFFMPLFLFFSNQQRATVEELGGRSEGAAVRD